VVIQLVAAFFLGGWMCTKTFTARGQISELDVQIAKLQPVLKEIERYETATAELAPKLDLLNEAKASTMRWYGVLDHLTRSMPESTYLTQVATLPPAEDGAVTVNISGISASQTTVGATMVLLQTSPDFSSVDLHFTRETKVGKTPAVEFEVGALIPPEEIRGETEDGQNRT